MTLKASNYPTVRPSLDLNFAQTERLDPRITYSRASSGTYFDSTGTLQSAVTNEARFDHDPTTGESLGLLVEEARTNLLTYSEQFDNSAWTKSNTNVTPNSALAPDGTFTADQIEPTGTGFFVLQTPLGSGTYTASVYVKDNGAGSCLVAMGSNTQGYLININTISGVYISGRSYGGGTLLGYLITPAGNGWFRVSVSATAAKGGLLVRNADGTSPTSGIYIWGAQLEASPYPTSYIPTSGSTVTRAADVATVTNSNVYDTDSFTIINQPFGSSAGASELTLFDGPEPIKRVSIYDQNLSQTTVNAAAKKTDEFWRWRILGSSFALPSFVTDGQVTVDWGDGTVETLTTSEHTFSNGGGYHDIGFRLDSGTYFRPYINDNASHDTKVVALGPAPVSMKLDANRVFFGCSNLEAFDVTVDTSSNTNFYRAWRNCSSLTSFPLIDTSSGTSFEATWQDCSSLTSFPLIDTSSGTNFNGAWQSCISLTSFPLIDTSSGTSFFRAWLNCSGLTSFPLINTSSGTNFYQTWYGCSGLASFPLINTSSGTNFREAWRNCSSLTSFPLINTSSGTNFNSAWFGCSSLTSFPLIDTSSGTDFYAAWEGCSSLTSFPLIDTSAGTNFSQTWRSCSSLTSFPLINTAAGTSFYAAWDICNSLTSFPLIDTSAGTDFRFAWRDCSSLTSFPLINTAAGTSFYAAWNGCSSLTSFPLIDTSAGTDFTEAWRNCSSLTSFPLIDTSSGATFSHAWFGCSSLTSFPANFFDSWSPASVNNQCFYNTWDGCSSLTPASVVNILDSIAASGQSAPSGTGTNDKKITIDWDGTGTPATTAAAAITTLKSRNWEIYLNGVLQ